ncbi:YozE family protein [Dolosicoccus paucivorans]|uniref:YozE SAM-like domain-containing protein n=1 Tax=Dolosicoccus paucivorans TaxID=84521 RepID=A0A1G8J5X0_9LACT|nr:YozE family protein [Dolosicoccus paucivorans]PMB84149.1 hypothetical protein CJ206_05495 [Dolosicoccus paucivorans]PMC59091.1 hypothetical protein CJ205_01090 [Dolosicoccus paucivorans]SDI26433.1 Uncharacterized protein YozE, UPF0346 family [Dolosicoccus paucivorans]
MQLSFYSFIIRFVDKDADDPRSRLANAVHEDSTFPKHTEDFEEITQHLEMDSRYSRLLSAFDDAWSDYQLNK